uniref:Serine/threonine-protein kinase DCLK1-like n=1 Tax=Stegastes partitus TaxID=144197 RepID=A0A3B5AH57_9TELE
MLLISGGDLFDAITSSAKYTERDASIMVYNLAGALKYLHSMSIVHRDIKPENLLVYGIKSLKLGDFGLATVVEGPLYTVCGTPTYVAPEIISESGQRCFTQGFNHFSLLASELRASSQTEIGVNGAFIKDFSKCSEYLQHQE